MTHKESSAQGEKKTPHSADKPAKNIEECMMKELKFLATPENPKIPDEMVDAMLELACRTNKVKELTDFFATLVSIAGNEFVDPDQSISLTIPFDDRPQGPKLCVAIGTRKGAS